MKTWNMSRLQLILLAASVLCGLSFATSDAFAREKITSENELLQKVEDADAGWDWVPRCGDNARWDADDDECRGGNGSDERNFNNRNSSSYDISSKAELISKIKDLDVGWNWEPRCGDGAHWSWDDNECRGGSGNGDDDDDNDDDDNDD